MKFVPYVAVSFIFGIFSVPLRINALQSVEKNIGRPRNIEGPMSRQTEISGCLISGFRSELDEICSPLGCYAA
jgi:hypothetical protein